MSKSIVRMLRTPRPYALIIVAGVFLALWGAAAVGAKPQARAHLQATNTTPTMINYQGIVKVSNDPYSGTGYFKFAIVDTSTGDGTTNYWANDGTSSSEPSSAVPLTVADGLFNVLLGNTSLSGMTQSIDESDVDHDPTYLRVWFSADGSSFESLEPNQRLASVPYALRVGDHDHFGDTWSGSAADGLRVDNTNSTGVALQATAPVTAVIARATSPTADPSFAIWGETVGHGYGVFGVNLRTDSYGTGVGGRSDAPLGIGVGGYATAFSGNSTGVHGSTNSTTGRAVYGIAHGYEGENYGVYGETQSDEGYAGFFLNAYGGNLLAADRDLNSIDVEFRVDNDGDVYADRAYYCGLSTGCFNSGTGADVAVRIDALDLLEAGDVVEIDPLNPGHFRKTSVAYSPLVAGVVSGESAVTMGNVFDADTDLWQDERPLLALAGIVAVKASAENGAIAPGDLLTSASIPGHAMRGGPVNTVIGKALEPLETGTGVIKMLVVLQ